MIANRSFCVDNSTWSNFKWSKAQECVLTEQDKEAKFQKLKNLISLLNLEISNGFIDFLLTADIF